MKLNSFLKECSEKEVFKMLSIYIVSSWVLIQVLAATWQPLALPEKSVTYLIILLLIGFPIYIFYIWKSRLAPLEKKDRITKKGRVKRSKFQKMYFTTLSFISILSVMATMLIINNAFGDNIELIAMESSDKIGVLKFGNNTGEADFDMVSKMSADWIAHGITENKLAQVVSPEIVSDYMGIINATETVADNEAVLKKYFKPAKVISGNYYLNGDRLIFQSSIMDGTMNETLISFKPIECDKGDPLECIENLKQMVLGYLIVENKGKLNLEQNPPKYDAYQYLLDAKANYSDKNYLSLLNKSIAADNNFFEPKVLKVAYYFNQKEFRVADSLRKTILPSARVSERQRNLLNHYEALIAGDNAAIYSTIKKEYNLAPFDLYSNSSTMVVALQYVNRAQDVDSIFQKIPMKEMNVINCIYCQFRYFTQGLAELELGNYQEVIDLLTPVVDDVNELYLKRPIIAAYIRSDNLLGLESFFEKQTLIDTPTDLRDAYMFALKEFLFKEDTVSASDYMKKIEAVPSVEDDLVFNSDYAYLRGDYSTAEKLLKKRHEEDAANTEVISKLAVSLHKNAKETDASKMLNKLHELKSEYEYGAIDYNLAQFYAVTGQDKEAYKYLLKSIAAGNSNSIQKYQNDLHFKNIRDKEEFKIILAYWHKNGEN